MFCRPSTSVSRTLRPWSASASARAAATVVLPVPPLPVTTCSRTPAKSAVTPRGYRLQCAGVRDGPSGTTSRHGTLLIVLGILVLLGLVTLAGDCGSIQQYERGVVFRLGKVHREPLGPGLNLVNPITDRVVKVNMQIIAMGVPAQEGITRDNISVRVDAVVYFRVMDPVKATVNVQNYMYAVSQVAQTSLRSVIGRSDLDQLLGERERINAILRDELDEPTEGPWGVRIERVEIKDVTLPESMKRSMSRQAEAERERRARVITADGEFQASQEAGAGRAADGRGPGGDAAAAAADRHRGGRREEQHTGHAVPGRAAALLRARRRRCAAGRRQPDRGAGRRLGEPSVTRPTPRSPRSCSTRSRCRRSTSLLSTCRRPTCPSWPGPYEQCASDVPPPPNERPAGNFLEG